MKVKQRMCEWKNWRLFNTKIITKEKTDAKKWIKNTGGICDMSSSKL